MENSLSREPDSSLSRRKWVDILLGSSFVAWGGAVVYPIVRYLTPAKDGGGGPWRCSCVRIYLPF